MLLPELESARARLREVVGEILRAERVERAVETLGPRRRRATDTPRAAIWSSAVVFIAPKVPGAEKAPSPQITHPARSSAE